MNLRQLTFAALTTLLISSALWSCTQDQTPAAQAQQGSAQAPQAPPTSPSAGGEMMNQLRDSCPMVVQGAEVAVTDTEGGVALTFTTDTGDVADLRTHVQHMAQMYELHRGQGGMMWHRMGGEGMERGGPGMGRGGPGMGGGMGHMAGRGSMPAMSTTMTDTDRGVRLELRPGDAAQLGELREHVRWHQQRMHSGECWMLQGQADAPGGESE